MKTRQDVVKTIRNLLSGLKEDPETWENATLDRYLDGMAAWLEDSEKSAYEAPSWELIIQMLEAAKIYE